MARTLKRFPAFIVLLLILAQSQTLWAATNNFLIVSTMPEQSLPMSVIMADGGNTALMLECVRRCDTATQSFNLLPFPFVSQSNILPPDRSARYLKAPDPRIVVQNIKIELPPPRV